MLNSTKEALGAAGNWAKEKLGTYCNIWVIPENFSIKY